jgi:hypothetical protein
VTDRYCRNCGHELAETDRFCPNCGTPVHEAAHVPTPEADVDVPSPPQQGVATTSPPDGAARDDFPIAFFTVAATIGGSVSASLAAWASWYPDWSVTIAQAWTFLAFAMFLGILLPIVLGVAFGHSVRRLRPLPTHVAALAIGTFLFGIICVVTVSNLRWGDANVVADFFKGYNPEFVLIPAGVSLTTAMFYTSSAFIGHAWRRQKAGESSRTSVREASDQPQTPRQQAMGRLSGETWTPRQQAIVGLIGTITAALIGLFGVLAQVFLSAD